MLLPLLGFIFNLYHMVNGTELQKYLWGISNAIVFGVGTVITGIFMLTYLYGTFEFFLCLGLTIGFGIAMLLGFLNIILAANMRNAPPRPFPTPSTRHDHITVATTATAEQSSSVPLWGFSF